MSACTVCGASLPDGARFCPACAAPVEAAGPSPTEERKLATLLFADLVGSTALADAEDPERVRVRLERFYDAMAAEIVQAGGTVEKFAGDAVMAVFGAPAAQEDHAERALHAALAMRRRLRELFGDELTLRIGVNTGDVVVGSPREGSSLVSGDPVNVAARLERAASPGEILAGERTVAAVRGAFEFAEPRTVEAKGKPGGVTCRLLVRSLSLMRPRGVAGLHTAFVGREAELELLEATYRRAVESAEPHLVTIMGDAGVGKTRLVRELWEWLAGEELQPLQRTGRCLPYGQMAYWALGEVLKEHLGILESDSPESVRERLGAREILGLTLGLDLAGELHPLEARDRLHEAWVGFLSELAGERPAVVLVEDLHWAEEPLLDLLERVLREVRGPLFVLGTGRPELLDRRPAWGGGRRNVSLLWLEALSPGEAGAMLGDLLAAELPERLREAIVERAGGNPFFVEELVEALIDQGVIERSNGGWRVSELPDGFRIPDSVQALLSARMDLLGPTEKAALQAASVMGRVFWHGPVCELLGGAQPDCAILEDRDFIRRRPGSSMAGETEYAFKHALTREVAYASLPKARRAHLHAAFAGWLESFGGGRDELAPILAHHLAEAVRPEDADLAWTGEEDELRRLQERAGEWLRRAAELAVRRYEIEEALGLLHRALELEPGELDRAELWREVGHAHALRYDGPAFWSAMQNSLEVCVDRAVCAETYAELAYQTAGRAGMWKKAPDPELVQGWIDEALELAEPGSPARAKALLATAFWCRDTAPGPAREASELAERLGDSELRTNAWVARGLVAFSAGHYDEALTWFQRPFDLVEEIRDPEVAAEIWWHPIPACVALGRFGEARRLARRYDELSVRLTPHHRVHGVSALVEVEELLGGWEQVRDLEERVRREVMSNLDTPCARNPRSLLVCALARAHLGQAGEARSLEAEAEALGMEGYPVLLNAVRLRLTLARGDLDRAAALLAEAPARHWAWFGLAFRMARLDALVVLHDREAVEAEATPLLRRGTYVEPFALRALGVVREDESLVADAQECFLAMGLGWHAAQTDALVRGASSL